MTDRILALEGVRNFRDFGGYDSAHGGQVRRGVLYRSGHYNEATDSDIAQVQARNIALQVDLRRPDERERQPGRWSAPNTLTNDGGREMQSPHVDFLTQVEADVAAAEDWMNGYYVTAPYKAHHVELFSSWFDTLAGMDADGAALVNCAAGKDRTGILCALTHHILGVSRADIATDYEMTNIAVDIDGRLPEAQRYFNDMLGKNYAAEVYRPFMGVRPRFLETAFTTIESQSGDVDAYLAETLGVTAQMRDAMIARLVAHG